MSLRVAIVAPTLEILGGHSVQAAALLEGWQRDADVDAWLVPINPAPPSWLARAGRIPYVRTLVTQLTYWPQLWRELRRADVVHVFSASYTSFLLAPLPAWLVARACGKPVLLNYHSGEAPDHLRRSRLARAVLRRVGATVVPSRFLVEVFAQFGLTAEAIPNVINRERFRFRRRGERLRPRLLSTRNFEPNYNVACTLRAFARVQARHPEATLTVVGSGGHEPALRALASSLGLRGVTFAGRVAPADMARYYDEADVYVQTPAVDNMPLSVLEAFSSGLPVVSTDAGGVRAMLTPDVHGLLAPLDDDAAIAAQVCRLLDEPGLGDRLAAAARRETDAYVWDAVRDRWAGAYARLVRPALTAFAAPEPS
jgi:glycosyltransferase involved in cell wall biosynthesis